MASSVVTLQEKLKLQTSVHKVGVSVFWNGEGILLVAFFERGATLNSERYVQH
jgi:hypothetical protein